MIDRLISFSIQNKLVIGMFVLALVGWGAYSIKQIPIDAVPDITTNQVQIITKSPTLAAQEVEQFVTFPIEIAMANLPIFSTRTSSRPLSAASSSHRERISSLSSLLRLWPAQICVRSSNSLIIWRSRCSNCSRISVSVIMGGIMRYFSKKTTARIRNYTMNVFSGSRFAFENRLEDVFFF